MPLHSFKVLRAALETTRGTAVPPTRGIEFMSAQHDQEIETIRPEQLRNSYFARYTAAAGTETNSIDVEAPVDFDIMAWWLSLHVNGTITATGAGTDKTWAFLPSGTTDNLKTATIQMGYTDGIGATSPAASLTYVMGDELTLNWDKTPGNPGVTLSSKLMSGRASTQISALTGVGTYTTSELAKANATVITIDPTTIGTTVDNDIVSASWTLNGSAVNLYTLNNTTAAQDILRPNPWDWTLELVRYVRNDNEWDRYVDKAKRKIRIKSTGSVIAGSAVPYSLALDCYGVLDGRKTAENDGLGMETLTYKPIYDTTAVTDFRLDLVNAIAAIT